MKMVEADGAFANTYADFIICVSKGLSSQNR